VTRTAAWMAGIGLLAGLVLGLLLRWAAREPEPASSTSQPIPREYAAEYAILIAEAFAADQSAAVAQRRLASMGPPEAVLPEAYATALVMGRSNAELALLADLAEALGVDVPRVERYPP